MNPTACSREAGADVSTQKTEQPEDDENYDDSPQHEISPFEVLAEYGDLNCALMADHPKNGLVSFDQRTTSGHNLSYSEQTSATSINWRVSVSATWGS
jgi:hypothetical protein